MKFTFATNSAEITKLILAPFVKLQLHQIGESGSENCET